MTMLIATLLRQPSLIRRVAPNIVGCVFLRPGAPYLWCVCVRACLVKLWLCATGFHEGLLIWYYWKSPSYESFWWSTSDDPGVEVQWSEICGWPGVIAVRRASLPGLSSCGYCSMLSVGLARVRQACCTMEMARLERVSDFVMMVIVRLATLLRECIRACYAQELGNNKGIISSVRVCLPPLKNVPTVLWLELTRRRYKNKSVKIHG